VGITITTEDNPSRRNFCNLDIILLCIFPAVSAFGFLQREKYLQLYPRKADFEFGRVFFG